MVRLAGRAAFAALAATVAFGVSQAAAAVTIQREVPVDSSRPYSPVPDGSVWTTYATSSSGGAVLHLDGQNGSILASFNVSEGGYFPQAIGYANNRVYIAEPGYIISLQVNGPSGTTNPGYLFSDGETDNRLGINQNFMRVSPDGTGSIAMGQNNKVATLNFNDLTANHPFYPQSFFGAGINAGGGTSFQTCHVDGPGTAPAGCGVGGGAGGPAPGQFDYPTDMAPDSANGFFVTEYYGNTVSHVTVDLNGVSADYNFGSGPGSAAGQLSSPDSIRRIPATGRLVISNPPNGRIDEFSPTGAYERSYGFGVLTGSDKFETCGVGIGACQAGVPYQSDPRSYFTQLDVVNGQLWAATELDHSIQVIDLGGAKVLTVSKSGSGTGTVSSSPAGISCGATCSHAYAQGTSATLTAMPASGSKFAGWSGACSGTGKTCKLVMSANKAVTAKFKPIPPPNTVITAANISSSKHTATFSFKGTGGVGARHFKCKLDGASFTACSSPKTYTGLTPGTHTFKVTAIDSRGKVDPTPAVKSFQI
jgi:hypothetical protein